MISTNMRQYHLVIYTLAVATIFYFVVDRNVASGLGASGKSYTRVAKSSPFINHQEHNTTRDAPVLVLHVGPPKVSSSTIQDSLDAHEDLLASDNYVYLGLRNPTGTRDTFGVRSGLIQFRRKKKTTLLDKLERQFQMFPQTNFIMSNEGFSIMEGSTDRNGVGFFKLLKRTAWKGRRHVVVAVGYRRYFAWIVSVYNQQYKSNRTFQPFVAWYRANIHSRIMRQKSPLQVYSYMKRQFKNVTVVNMHGESQDVMSQMYCNVLPQAPNVCKAYMAKLATKIDAPDNGSVVEIHSNPSVPIWPRAIAREAQLRGLLSFRGTSSQVEESVVAFAKSINYTSFPQQCLSQRDLDYLLETSLSHEQQVLPDFYASAQGEDTLRKEFQVAVEGNKFCSVDAKVVLRDQQWLGFFRELASTNATIS